MYSCYNFFLGLKIFKIALAGMAQWIEYWPVSQGVSGSVPGPGTCVGHRLGPQLGV